MISWNSGVTRHDDASINHGQIPSRDRKGAVLRAAMKQAGPKAVAHPIPLAYLITFTCYGTRLHGVDSGSVDRQHNIPGSPYLPPDTVRRSTEQKLMKQGPYQLDAQRRIIVLNAIKEARFHKGWNLLAAHVRREHVHIVVGALETPEKVLNHFKSFASRALNQAAVDGGRRIRWTRHGSTGYLWKPQQVQAAVEYVVYGQGRPMAVWRSTDAPW